MKSSNGPSMELLISRLDRAERVLQRQRLTSSERARIEARAETLKSSIAEIEGRLS